MWLLVVLLYVLRVFNFFVIMLVYLDQSLFYNNMIHISRLTIFCARVCLLLGLYLSVCFAYLWSKEPQMKSVEVEYHFTVWQLCHH